MADVNLEDLLKKKESESNGTNLSGGNDLPVAAETERITRAVEELTPDERQRVDKIKDGIDLTDSSTSIQYGTAAQKDIADFSDGVLSRVRMKDSGEVGKVLGELVSEIKGFEPAKDEGFLSKLPFVGSIKRKADNMMEQYRDVATQIDRISASLDRSRTEMMQDIATFDGLYAKNLEYFKALELYIVAGEEKLKEMHETTLPKLRAQAADSSDPMAAQVVNDFEESVKRFEKKVHDLKLSKMIAIQTAPQIRLIQNSDKDLVDRIQSAVYNTIPLWKNQMVIALGLSRQRDALQKTRAVNDTTNKLLTRNAELLKQNTIEAAQENERSIVDIETIKKVNENLISTIQETMKIQQEGRTKRIAAEKELAHCEDQLKKSLLEASNRKIN